MKWTLVRDLAGVGLAAVMVVGSAGDWAMAQSVAGAAAVVPGKMAKIATVDERYQSFNVEMLEVTGGRFWAPYKAIKAAGPEAGKASVPTGMDPSLYRYREPIDLGDARLRKLAAALGPIYLRVSGTWANSTYFQDNDEPQMKTPPTGFGGVLTQRQWKGVLDFSKAVDAKIVTSFAVTPGVRDAEGVWTPVEAKKFLAYTKQAGGTIAAAEMFNEPTFSAMGGVAKGYDGAAYGRDFKAFRAYMKSASPEMLILGPGSIAEAGTMGEIKMKMLSTRDILTAAGRGVDGFSYHFYGQPSQRCRPTSTAAGDVEKVALSDDWLMRTTLDYAYYKKLRDQFEPGKPMWLTESGEAACGGDPWAATYLDSFRYLNQLGALAKVGVRSVMHNTLAASDYAVVDEESMMPRPNYWAALLWRKMMGSTVLEAGVAKTPGMYVYAHCERGVVGGVSLLVINADAGAHALRVPVKSERYTLSAKELQGGVVELNGVSLGLSAAGEVPKLQGKAQAAGRVEFGGRTITFLGMGGAGNGACK